MAGDAYVLCGVVMAGDAYVLCGVVMAGDAYVLAPQRQKTQTQCFVRTFLCEA
jgi:hypothetical protein